MKKKISLILMIIVTLFALTGCSSDPKMKIIDNEGKSVEMTAKELLEAKNNNDSKYKSLYIGAYATVKTKVKYVKDRRIYLEGGIFTDYNSSLYDVNKIEVGDTVEVQGNIETTDKDRDGQTIFYIKSLINGLTFDRKEVHINEWVVDYIGTYVNKGKYTYPYYYTIGDCYEKEVERIICLVSRGKDDYNYYQKLVFDNTKKQITENLCENCVFTLDENKNLVETYENNEPDIYVRIEQQKYRL